MPRKEPIKVVVVDDSLPIRSLLNSVLSEGGDFEVLGTLADGEAALRKIPRLHPDVVILDVRTPGETAAGMIEGAVEIDFRGDNFKDQISALDKDKTYLVYCKSGGRSASACEIMQEMGFEKLYNLDGGYTRWSAENH